MGRNFKRLLATLGVISLIQFGNPIVGESTLLRAAIQSEGFVSGSQGWRIARNGDAEFNNAQFRGDVILGTPPGKRIELRRVPGNTVDFYTGDVDEIAKGVIKVDQDLSGRGLLRIQPPRFSTAGGFMPYLEMINGADTVGYAEMYSPSGRVGGNSSGISWYRFDSTDPVSWPGYMDFNVEDASGSWFFRLEKEGWLPTGEYWHTVGSAGEPAFAGNWTVSGAFPVAFFRDASRRVQLRGRAQETVAASTTLFTLPVGYRPTQSMSWPVKSNADGGTITWLTVATNGTVTLLGNVAQGRVQTILDSVSFPTY